MAGMTTIVYGMPMYCWCSRVSWMWQTTPQVPLPTWTWFGTEQVLMQRLPHRKRIWPWPLKRTLLELCFEGHRWFDLLRSGRLTKIMTDHSMGWTGTQLCNSSTYERNDKIIPKLPGSGRISAILSVPAAYDNCNWCEIPDGNKMKDIECII